MRFCEDFGWGKESVDFDFAFKDDEESITFVACFEDEGMGFKGK
jgi:hypothetical protein